MMGGNRVTIKQGLIEIVADTTVDDTSYAPQEVWALPAVPTMAALVLVLEAQDQVSRMGVRVTFPGKLPGSDAVAWALEWVSYQGVEPVPLVWVVDQIADASALNNLYLPVPLAVFRARLVATEPGKKPVRYPEATIATAGDTALSDDILSPAKKPASILTYATLTGEQAGIDAQAVSFTCTAVDAAKATYDASVTALTVYLGTLAGWNVVPGSDVVIVGTTFRSKFSDVTTKRQALLNAVSAQAKALADAAQVTGNSAIARTSIAKTLEYWTFSGTSSIVTLTDGMSGTKALRMPVGSGYPNAGAYHAIDPTRSYKTKFYARASSGCDGMLDFSLRQFTDNVGTPTSINGGRSPYIPVSQPAHTAWVLYEHTWKGSDFQAGVRFVQPEFLGNYAGTLGYWEIQDFNFFEITETDAAQAAAISAAATDASTKANLAQLQSQPHQVAWAYTAKPALPSALYPAGYYAITTDSRTVQVNPAGTAWTDVLVAATGLFGQIFANQLVVANFDNLCPNPNCTNTAPPPGSLEAAGLLFIGVGSIGAIGAGNGYCRNIVSTSDAYIAIAKVPCNPGDRFTAKAIGATSSPSGSARIQLQFQNNAGVGVGNFVSGDLPLNYGNVTQLSVDTGVAPAGTLSVTLYLAFTGVLSGSQQAYFNNFYFRRMVDGSLIVDGDITATKIRAGEIKSLVPPYVQDASGNATAGFKLGNDGSDPTPRGAKFAASDIRIGNLDFTDFWFRLLQGIDNPTSSLVVWRGNNDVTMRGGAPLIADNDAWPAVNPRLLINTVKTDNTGSYIGSTTLHFQCQPLANTDNLDSMSHIACIAYRKTGATMALGDRNAANAYFYPTISSRRYKTYLTPSDPSNAGHGMHVWTSPNASVVNDCTEGLSGSNYPLVLVAQLCNVHGDSTAHYFIPPSLVGNGNLSTTGRWTDVGNVAPYTGAVAPPSGGGGGGGYCPAPWLKVTLASGLLVDAGDLYDGAVLKGADDSSFASMTGTVSDYQKVWRSRLEVVLEDGTALVFSRDHRLAVIDRGWVTVQDLHVGDLLMAERRAIVKGVQPFPDGIVCGFVVSGCHTYFTDGILSHNIKAPAAW